MKRFLHGWHIWVVAVLLVLVIGSVLFLPREPSGRFANPYIATIGLSYYEFKDGAMTVVYPEGASRLRGTYFKRDRDWVFQTPDGYETPIKANLLALKMDDHWYWRYNWLTDWLEMHTKLGQ